MRDYGCWDCEKFFNTDHDHLNHMNLVHRSKVYKCTQCSFTAPVESRIRSHARTHAAQKFECQTCDAQLSSKAALRRHAMLHLATEELRCSKCDRSYALKLALSVHEKGKHRSGYICDKCDQKFDAPIKKARHLRKCGMEVRSNSPESPPPPLGTVELISHRLSRQGRSEMQIYALQNVFIIHFLLI